MADLITLISTGSLPKFLKHIQTAGKPDKVTNKYLKGVGFTSSNDAYLIGVLKGIGFVDQSGVPQSRWVAYKDTSKAKAVLADGIRHAYSGLFATFPDAEKKDDDAIKNWMRANHPEASDLVVGRAVNTFRALCKEADFGTKLPDQQAIHLADSDAAEHVPAGAAPPPSVSLGKVGGITINIELQLPSSADATFFEDFFAAMRRHLLRHDE